MRAFLRLLGVWLLVALIAAPVNAQTFRPGYGVGQYRAGFQFLNNVTTFFSADFTNGDTLTSKGFTFARNNTTYTAYANTSAGLLTGFAANVQRCVNIGCLLEASDINNWTASNGGFNNTPWNFGPPTRATMSGSGTTDPAGGSTAFTWTDTSAATGPHLTWGLLGLNVANGIPYAGSIFLGPGATNPSQFGFVEITDDYTRAGPSSNLTMVFDLNTCAITDFNQTIGTSGSGGRLPFNATVESFAANGYCRPSVGFATRGGNNYSMTFGTSDSGTPTYFTGTNNQTKFTPTFTTNNAHAKMKVFQSDTNNNGYPLMPIPTTSGTITSVADDAAMAFAAPTGNYTISDQVKQVSNASNAGNALLSLNDCPSLAACTPQNEILFGETLNNQFTFSIKYQGVTTVVGTEPLSNVPTLTKGGITVGAPARTVTLSLQHDSTGYCGYVDALLIGCLAVPTPVTTQFFLGENAAKTLGANLYTQKVSIIGTATLPPGLLADASTCCIVQPEVMVATATTGPVTRTETTKLTHIMVVNGANDQTAGNTVYGDLNFEFTNKVLNLWGFTGTQCEASAGTPDFGKCDAIEGANANKPLRLNFATNAGLYIVELDMIKSFWLESQRQVLITSFDTATGAGAVYRNRTSLTTAASGPATGPVTASGLIPSVNGYAMKLAGDWPNEHPYGRMGDEFLDVTLSIACVSTTDITVAGVNYACPNGAGSIPDAILNKIMAWDFSTLEWGPTASNWTGAQPDVATMHLSAANAAANYGSANSGVTPFSVTNSLFGATNAANGGWSTAQSNSAVFDMPFAWGASVPTTAPYNKWSASTIDNTTGTPTYLVVNRSYNDVVVGDMLTMWAGAVASGTAFNYSLTCPAGWTDAGITKYDGGSLGRNLAFCYKVAVTADTTIGAGTITTGTIVANLLTVSGAYSGTPLGIGTKIRYTSAGGATEAIIVSLGTGVGGIGTYNLTATANSTANVTIAETGWVAALTPSGHALGAAFAVVADLGKPTGSNWTFDAAASSFPSVATTINSPSGVTVGGAGTAISSQIFFDWYASAPNAGNYLNGTGINPRLRWAKKLNFPFVMLSDEMNVPAGTTTARTVSVCTATSTSPACSTQNSALPMSGAAVFH